MNQLSGDLLNSFIYSVLKVRSSSTQNIVEYIDSHQLELLLKQVTNSFENESTLLELNGNFIVVGDLHGNIDDFLRIFQRCDYPPKSNYLFLGDYVDRGKQSLEVLLVLFILKLKYPNNIYLLRGNHETPTMNLYYGFYTETCEKYDEKIYYQFNNVFKYLPMAAVINNSIFCVHGGISPQLHSLSDIKNTAKVKEISDVDLFNDMVWSDPTKSVSNFENSPRGTGYHFGSEAINSFLDQNHLDFIIRAHEYCSEGFSFPLDSQQIITVFSTSDYCNKHNSASVLTVRPDCQFTVVKFDPLSSYQKMHSKIIYPSWLCEFLATDHFIQM